MSGHAGLVVAIFLVILSGLGLELVRKGFKLRKERELIEETPTADIESVSIGPAELKGTANAIDGPIVAPFSDEECLVADWKVEEWQQSDDSANWHTIDSGVDYTKFTLDDGTGPITVDPDPDARFAIENGSDTVIEVAVDETPPDQVREFLHRHDTPGDPGNIRPDIDIGNQDGDRRYTQNLLLPDGEAYVYGAVRRDETSASGELVIGKSTDGVHSEMFMISDMREQTLLDKRDWALMWRLPVGALVTAVGIGGLFWLSQTGLP